MKSSRSSFNPLGLVYRFGADRGICPDPRGWNGDYDRKGSNYDAQFPLGHPSRSDSPGFKPVSEKELKERSYSTTSGGRNGARVWTHTEFYSPSAATYAAYIGIAPPPPVTTAYTGSIPAALVTTAYTGSAPPALYQIGVPVDMGIPRKKI